MATEVGIREFKNKVSGYIQRVQAGEVVTVTNRGKPVARLIPAGLSPTLAKLIASGGVHWNGKKPALPRSTPLRGKGKSAVDYVLEGRR